MRKMLTTILRLMLAVAILTVISFTWGNQMVSPNVNFGENFFVRTTIVHAEENTYQLQWVENEDETFTVTLLVNEKLGGFDYGIAFSPKEVTVVEYGFMEQFKDHYSDQQGSVIDHYFSEGKRVSETAQYIVYGGMATKTDDYDGQVCYVTVSLKGNQAVFYGVKDSATYEHASELMTGEVSCTVVKEENGSNGNESKQDDFGEDETAGSNTGEEDSHGEEQVGSDDSQGNSVGEETPSQEETSSKGTSQDNAGKSISKNGDTKALQIVKTGDDSRIAQYILAIAVATFVFVMTGRKFFQKN